VANPGDFLGSRIGAESVILVRDKAFAEDRLVAVGRSESGRRIFVVFTLRERDGRRSIRPITARYMHAREIRRYDAAST
jgi:hypothetical protein